MVQFGPGAAMPHGQTGRRRLGDGDSVVVDFVIHDQGYYGDMTRTYFAGDMNKSARIAFEAVRDAHRAAIDAARPGITCEALDRVARGVIERAGLGDCFTHRLGHGIGLDGHEPPYLVGGNGEQLVSGMCVTIEPGVYVPGQFGVRIEDVIVITDHGCNVVSEGVPVEMDVVHSGLWSI
jgi:Xaa-Pro aminopeptidase